MAAKSHHPDDRPGWSELGDVLRPALAQVRAVPPPPEAVDRALARARRLGGAPRASLPPRAVYIASALAASLLLGLGLHFSSPFIGRPAGPRPAGRPGPEAREQAASLGPVIVRPRLPGFDGDDTLQPAGLGQIARSWGEWERLRDLRTLAADLPTVEGYLSHPVSIARLSQPLVWTNRPRPEAVARITDSDGRSLQLQGAYVQARLQGARARTVVELVFYNPHELAVDGLLECALPEGASPSWLTLFRGGGTSTVTLPPRPPGKPPVALPAPDQVVSRICQECWGAPRTAAVVPADAPLAPNRHLDEGGLALRGDRPAGNLFGGQLGPIGGKKHIRVVLAYEQLLPLKDGRLVYTYTAPPERLFQLTFKLQIDGALDRRADIAPAELQRVADEGLVTYTHSWRNAEGAEVTYRTEPPSQLVQSASGQLGGEGPYYLHARLRPGVEAAKPAPYARHAVFLLDTSAAEDGARFARRVKLMQKALEADAAIEHFNVLVCTTSPAWLDGKRWLPNTAQGRADAAARLEGMVLEGATDLAAAFGRLANPAPPAPAGTPVHGFFLCDGRATWGADGAARLAATAHTRARWAIRWHCYTSGARDEDAELYAALTRQAGGTYRLGGDADLSAAASAHAQPCLAVREVRVVGGPAPVDVLVEGGRPLVYPGGDLVVAARFPKPGATRLEVIGDLNGRRTVQSFPVEVAEGGELAPRAWGEVAVRELLATRGDEAERAAERIARALGIASRATRFAFLIDDAPPRPLLADDRVDRRVADSWRAAARPRTAADRRAALQAATGRWLGPTAPRQQLLEALALLDDREFVPPAAAAAADLPARSAASGSFLAGLKERRDDLGLHLDEASRRAKAGNAAGAVRCLSGLVGEHPDRADVARVVGCRLVAMGRPAEAVSVLGRQVERDGHDPANHRALALALAASGRRGLAVFHAEAAHALLGGQGGWYAAAREDLAGLLRLAAADARLSRELRDHCRSRLEEIGPLPAADVLVTMTWCTVAARLELAVVEPGGKRTRAELPTSRHGRAGPLRVRLDKAPSGALAVEATYRDGDSRTVPEVAATIEVVRHAGTPRQTVQRHAVVFRRPGDSWRGAVTVTVAGTAVRGQAAAPGSPPP